MRKVVVSGTFPDESAPRTVEGIAKDWRSDQWKETECDQRLAYRGAREWSRRHAPGAILGVYSPDEMPPTQPAKGRVVDEARETPLNPFDQKTIPDTPEVKDEVVAEQQAPVDPLPVSSDPATTSTPGERYYITKVTRTDGVNEKTGREWTRFRVELASDETHLTTATFSSTVGRLALDNLNQFVFAEVAQEERGTKLISITEIDQKTGKIINNEDNALI